MKISRSGRLMLGPNCVQPLAMTNGIPDPSSWLGAENRSRCVTGLMDLTLDDQVFFRHSCESRNPEGFSSCLDSGSPLRYARNDSNLERFALKNLIIE